MRSLNPPVRGSVRMIKSTISYQLKLFLQGGFVRREESTHNVQPTVSFYALNVNSLEQQNTEHVPWQMSKGSYFGDQSSTTSYRRKYWSPKSNSFNFPSLVFFFISNFPSLVRNYLVLSLSNTVKRSHSRQWEKWGFSADNCANLKASSLLSLWQRHTKTN
jgi:hypothetical protein